MKTASNAFNKIYNIFFNIVMIFDGISEKFLILPFIEIKDRIRIIELNVKLRVLKLTNESRNQIIPISLKFLLIHMPIF